MIVVDCSAAVEVLTGDEASRRTARIRNRLTETNSIHAPYLIDTEVQSAIRGLVLGRRITSERGEVALRRFGELPLLRYPAQPFAEAVWKLRDSLTTYDATYVVLAAQLGCPLVTCDRKIARAVPGIVEVF